MLKESTEKGRPGHQMLTPATSGVKTAPKKAAAKKSRGETSDLQAVSVDNCPSLSR